MASALIALGGNLGDVRAVLRAAIADLGRTPGIELGERSSDYLTPPWGNTDQPPFINTCVAIETGLGPHELLQTLQHIESRHGRDRSRETRWGPRSLDLDLIAYDDLVLDTPDLILPHPRALERAFVLVPLADIAPDRWIGGRTVADALRTLPRDGIVRLPDAT